MEIFKLFGSIFVDDKDAIDKINNVDDKAKNTGTTLGSMIGTAAKWGAGIATAASAAGAGLFALASKVSDTASEINDMSVRTGLSTKTLQEMKFATGQVGVNFESITGAVGKLTKTMAGADDGSKAAEAAFAKLGISVTDSEGNMRKMDEMFPEVIKGLAGMQNETERNALAMNLFGKGALELAPLLSAGGEGIDALAQQAHDLGLVMSGEAISAGDDFGDSLDAIKGALGGVVASIGVELMPTFQTMFDWIMSNMPAIQDGIHTAVGFVTNLFMGMGDAVQFVTDHSNILLPVIIGLTAAIAAQAIIETINNLMKAWSAATKTQTAFQWLLNAAMNANPIGLVALAIGGLIAAGIALYQNWDLVKEKLGQFWEFFKEHWDQIVAFAGPIGLLVAAGVNLYKNWDTIKEKAGQLGDKVKEVFGDAKDFVLGVWDGMAGGIKGSINLIINALNGMIRGMNKINFSVPDWVPSIGGKGWGFNLKEIPMLAKGTDFFEGGPAIVGERGMELVNLPRGSQVVDSDRTEELLNNTGAPGYIQTHVYLDSKEIAVVLHSRTQGRSRGMGVTSPI